VASVHTGAARRASELGISITGGVQAGNYTLNGVTTAATTANITARTLVVTATGVNKVYDRNTSATVTLGTDKLAGDYVTVGYTRSAVPTAEKESRKAV